MKIIMGRKVYMKKLPVDYQYLKIAIYVMLVIFCAIIFENTLSNIGSIVDNVLGFFKNVQGIFSTFVYGFFIAYILNPIVKFMENKIFVYVGFLKERAGLKRLLSLAVTYIVVVGLVVWCISFLIPEIYGNVRTLIRSIQVMDFNTGVYDDNFLTQFIDSINETFGTNYNLREIINLIIEPFTKSLMNIPSLINMVWASTTAMASGVVKALIGLIISFYMLMEKETLGKVSKKFVLTFFRIKDAEKVIGVVNSGNDVFQKFIIGKAIDSLIIGIIFFITCIFIDPPYALLLSLIVGVTNMIPYFGPFIGAVPVILIVLLYNPLTALWIAIDILIIQQFDGNILGPKIIGDSTGLTPLGVIFAITAGGAMFGVLGMFLGVPLFAVVKNLGAVLINRIYNKKYQTP